MTKKAIDVSKNTLQKFVESNVEEGSTISNDGWLGYQGLSQKFSHRIVAHSADQYVSGEVHSNRLENF